MSYNVLDSLYSDLIYKCVRVIKDILNCDVYVFGSYAKGCVKPTSDLDLLVLVEETVTFSKKIEYLGIIEDSIYAKVGFVDLDIKIIGREDFKSRIKEELSFAAIVSEYMVEVAV